MIAEKRDPEFIVTSTQQAKEQEARPEEDNRPKLRGRAAAKAKASREAKENAKWEELRKTFIWGVADVNKRRLTITTVPKLHLEAIPNIKNWLEGNTHPFQDDEPGEASRTITIAADSISIASSLKLLSLPGSSVVDEDEIDIITCSQVAQQEESLPISP
ncbi:hypothetical protein HYE67_002942 [Fusarium culmorum]|uniref:Uncharacterized protein n=1 Tax=Fusarium culmorum TaxID=5516 RepID=A0A2T4GG53_FUSCU|nr:hypothetical protein FCULG_00012621 [Fusarium culmorum]QPC60711.1 hypothetical protein HYE67_002942 [Fusarium culmorum]